MDTSFSRRLSSRRWRATGLAAAAVALLALGACSHGPQGPWQEGSRDGHAHGAQHGHHHGGRGGPMSGPMSPEQTARMAERMAERIVGAADGTPEQKQKIQAIAQAAFTDLAPMREQMHTARRDAMALLAAPTVDRAAIEALRARQIAAADGASRRMAQAMADAAEVLTPEQRARLAERMQRWMGRRG
jgi:Spy/CpxP family protein refolding chaperone